MLIIFGPQETAPPDVPAEFALRLQKPRWGVLEIKCVDLMAYVYMYTINISVTVNNCDQVIADSPQK
jgi:hypothetical protein